MKALRRVIVKVLILLFILIGLCYAQSTAEQCFNNGVEYAAQGKFDEAKAEFEKALNIDPFYETVKVVLKVIEDIIHQKLKSEIAIHLFAGIAYRLKGQWDDAIAESNKAIEVAPRFAYVYIKR